MKRALWLSLVAGCLGLSPAAQADGRFTLESVYQQQTWEESKGGPEATLTQGTVRAALGVNLSSRVHLDLMSIGNYSKLEPFPQDEASAADVFGGMPLRGRLTWTVGDRLMIRVGGGSPMVGEIQEDELALAQTMAARVLGMETNLLRDGYAVDAGVAYALPLNESFSAGAGVGYLYKGGYTVVEPEFIPGAQVSLGGGVDYTDPAWLCRFNGRVVLYANDQLDAEDFQQEGPRVEGQLLARRTWSRSTVWASSALVHFLKGKVWSGDKLVKADEVVHGDELYVEAGGSRKFTPKVQGELRLGIRQFSSNGFDMGGADQLTARLSLGFNASPQATVTVFGGLNGGTLNDPHPVLHNVSEADLSGFVAGLRLTRDFN